MKTEQLTNCINEHLSALRCISDMLGEVPDLHLIHPSQLYVLLSILADRLEFEMKKGKL